ncbi:RNA 2'-phosphotransferase [Clostridium scatologenes]|uniref:Phosphotransferase KptA/Tpt1 n=1 Tax=Clostridium scatologenes TaxID=1548 RepID=A0A0E3M6I9_CLOSL|nr:phosphotransferase KptA/Tpt1 [Clostridium scatologenes]
MNSIENSELLPKGRQYVHLSNDIETALQVGKRHDDKPVILEIDAKKAWDEGVKFYLGNDKVWLADNIPSKDIKVTS